MNPFIGPEMSEMFSGYYGLIKNESDRGAIIVAVSLFDVGLEKLIKATLVKSNPENNDPLFSGPTAPLGSFYSKTELAYRLGLLRKNTRDMLHYLRKLRNEFAHETHTVSMNDKPIEDKIKNLFLYTPDMYTILKDEVVSNGNFMEVDIDKDKIMDQIPVRHLFNLYFALNASALNGSPHETVRKTA
ncbi:hypothetical protein [uncultured Desulfobulbus sp.]|uniref:hypothetical protein n=1 Tax=uncultured Desulfobulbus sp. TaxID=239745 RepID=UPI0029C68BAB|nr:hypothetical protein [uncultured Desulfobulbus sp.]